MFAIVMHAAGLASVRATFEAIGTEAPTNVTEPRRPYICGVIEPSVHRYRQNGRKDLEIKVESIFYGEGLGDGFVFVGASIID